MTAFYPHHGILKAQKYAWHSANNTNYICINKNYIYNVSVNYASHINVPMYELDIYKNNNKNIDDFEEYNFYDILQDCENILFSQELKLIN